MPGIADGDAISRYQVLGEQAVSIMGHTSKCCMVGLILQSHASASFENPHLICSLLTGQPVYATGVPSRLSRDSLCQLGGVRHD